MFRKIVAVAWKNGRRLVDDAIRIQKGKAPNKKLRDRDVGISCRVEACQPKRFLHQNNKAERWIEKFAGNRESIRKLAFALRQKTKFGLPVGSCTIFRQGCGARFSLYTFVCLGFAARSEKDPFSTDHFDDICNDIQSMIKTKGSSIEQDLESETNSGNAKMDHFELGPLISKGCAAAVHEARMKDRNEEKDGEFQSHDNSFEVVGLSIDGAPTVNEEKYNLAVKVMFNYDCESNGYAIKKGMEKELLPSKEIIDEENSVWHIGRHPKKKKRLSPHPNIIEFNGVFVDEMQELDGSLTEYPDSLPARLNPYGFGRNKTLFIVMKKFPFTLEDYILQKEISFRNSVVMFSQLLEGVLHINQAVVAHRDLKSNNILVEEIDGTPHLVITDFGCCYDGIELESSSHPLKVPYLCDDMGKGGNFSLMAPEIANAKPGQKSYLDYRKSDLWAAGTLVYEIFGMHNPFYHRVHPLINQTYNDCDLPGLPESVPGYLQNMVKAMLRKNPDERPETLLAANALQIILFAPNQWLRSLEEGNAPPCKVEIMRWLLTLAAQYILQQKQTMEHKLAGLFLSRLDLDEVMDAVHFLWDLKSVD